MPIYGCASAMVVTNSHFTRQARALAKSNGVVLWDRERLVRHMLRMPTSIRPLANLSEVHPLNKRPNEILLSSCYWVEQPSGQRVALTENPTRIGRDPSNDLVLPDESVSRQHAKVIFEHGRPILIDLDSKNVAWVNGERIRRHLLKPDDRIRIERHTFIHHVD